MKPDPAPVSVLSIAGSDTSGGAGIQADIKTISVCGAYALTAVTAITAQGPDGVRAVWPVSPEQLHDQVEAALAYQPAAIKVGMLGTGTLVRTLADILDRHPTIPVILDTIIYASSGARLLDEDGVAALRSLLLPRATLATPNAIEARALFGEDFLAEAQQWSQESGRAVLVTGGDSNDEYCTDTLLHGDQCDSWRSPRIETRNLRGTGCALTSAIASFIAQGMPLAEAVKQARGFVRRALSAGQAERWPGNGPLKHFHEFDMHRFQEQ